MDKILIAKTLKTVKETSPKRNFKQSIDLVINLKDIDLKKPEHQVNTFISLNHSNGRKISICAFVSPEMESKAKEVCDEVISSEKFEGFRNKKEIKQLANRHDYFISQADIMPKVATVFGRFLGPRGKMPNPKVGAVIPQNANVKVLYDKLSRTINLITKNEPTIKCLVGKEDSSEDEVVDNIFTIYNSLLPKLPNEIHNIKSVMLKLTMGPSFAVKEDAQESKDKKTRQRKKFQAANIEAQKKQPEAEKTKKEKSKKENKQKESKEKTG